MKWLEELYCKVWYASEFLLTPLDRRPWTFCMRDFIFLHPKLGGSFIGMWYAGLIALHFYCSWVSLVLGILSSFVLAHVVWGSKFIENEQEQPPYLSD